MADLSLSARALKLKLDIKRVLSGSAAIFLPADVKDLLSEQAAIIAALAQIISNLQGEDF